jgi:hypothetical protein
VRDYGGLRTAHAARIAVATTEFAAGTDAAVFQSAEHAQYRSECSAAVSDETESQPGSEKLESKDLKAMITVACEARTPRAP